ncbi:MAG: hypothetical protein IKR50_04540 [Prevotella sp.]|nr:hypothetical protein [Prevotella sp.]
MNHTCCYSRWLATALTVVAAVFSASAARNAAGYVPRDVVWTTQSHNSSESMPCGGCDIGLNVWVEGGDLLFYAQQSGWFDENNTLLKAGRWRLRIDGQPFSGSDFRQRLCLDEGAIYISGGGVEVRLWADVESPVVFAAILSQHTRRAVLNYENWRYRDRPVTKAECQQCSYKWLVPASCVTFADSISAADDRLTFSHQNRRETVFDFTVSREQLDAIKDSLYNPIGSLLMQGTMQAPGFRFSGTTAGTYASTDFRAWNFRCDRLRRSVITITLSAGMSGTLPSPPTPRLSQKRSAVWWHQYWQRSWIVSNTPNDSLQTMLRNYELMRYMLGCNARGEWPTKFNGGLFTFDPVYADTALAFTPDYRKWGGGTMTAQNQRLVYWPLLKSGDYDVLQPQIETYRRMLPNAIARTRHYWGHGGASFTEQIENFGLPNPAEYGKHKEGDDPGVERNAWLEYEWDTALEFALMESLSSLTPAPYPKERGEPLGAEILRFFVEHYRWQARKLGAKELDADGRLIIYPGSGCETYKMAYNPSSTIAALQATAHLAPLTSAASLVPPIPLRVIGGDTCIAPAVAWARVQNVETPQLYPVWPWRIYGMGRPRLDIARNTYWKDPHALQMRSTKGWKQDNIWAACLGLTDEARRLNLAKLADGPYRFTAFYDPGFDWAPDHNRGGAGMVGLQEMLLQETPDGQPILFPAWPRQWNCSFRLRTLGGRTIEATIANGKIVYAEK